MKSRPMTDSEINSVLSHLDNPRDRALFVVGVKTGFRISELLSIRISDLMQYGSIGDTITVRRSSMKCKRSSRTVPLHSQAKQAIEDYLQSRSYNLHERLFEITRKHAWRIISNAAEKAQLSGTISTHSMRKSFGMKIYELTGRNIVAAQRALGHASLASTSHYLSVGDEEVNKAILA